MLPKNEAVRRSRGGRIQRREKKRQTTVTAYHYSTASVEEIRVTKRTQFEELRRSELFKWIDVEGTANEEVVRTIGEVYDLHPLALEDVMKGGQRPKAEQFQSCMFFITHLAMMVGPGDVEDVQVNMFIGSDFVITFTEDCGGVFDPVRERIRHAGSRIRTSGVDYLAYSIIDVILDHYFPVLEELGDYFQDIEDQVTEYPDPKLIRELQQLRRELLCVRRAIWPQRDALNVLLRGEDPYFTANVRVYLRDCYDHCVQIIDVTETYRELATGLVDLYHSSLSTRLNEVMKVLAIISTIFMPLSFWAGVYGMNFKYMPELEDPIGYLVWWGIAFVMTIIMVAFFWRMGWIGFSRRPKRPKRTRSHGSNYRKAGPKPIPSPDTPSRSLGGQS